MARSPSRSRTRPRAGWLCVVALLSLSAAVSPVLAQGGAPASAPDFLNDGRALAREGKFSEAADKLRAFVAAGKDAERLRQARLELADVLIKAGLVLQATDVYAEYVRLHAAHPSAPEARRLLALSQEAQGKFPAALATYRHCLEAAAEFPAERVADMLWRIAEIQDCVLDKPKEAIDDYRAFARRCPRDARVPEAELRAARLLDKTRKWREAAEAYADFAQKHPTHSETPSAILRVAQIYDDSGLRDYEKCAAFFRRYAETWPALPDARGCMIRAALVTRDRLRNQKLAVELYDLALKMRRDEETAWQRLDAVWQSGNYEQAREGFAAFIKEFPQSSRARAARQRVAGALAQLKKTDEALAAWEALIADYPADNYGERWEVIRLIESSAAKAPADQAAREWKRAFEHWNALIRDDNTHGGSGRYYGMTNAAVQSRDPDILKRCEQTLAEVLPRVAYMDDHYYAVQWSLLENIYRPRGENQKVIETARSLIERLPHSSWSGAPSPLTRMIEAYVALKRPDEAVRTLRELHARVPYSPTTRLGRAMAAKMILDQGDAQAALADAAALIDPALDDSASADATLTAAECLAKSGDDFRMLSLFARSASFRLEPWHNRLHARIDADRRQILDPLLKKHVAEKETAQPGGQALQPSDLLKRAMLRHAMGEFPKAIEDYAAFLKSKDAQGELLEQAQALQSDAQNLATLDACFTGGEIEKLPTMTLMRRAHAYAGAQKQNDAINAWKLAWRRSPLNLQARLRAIQTMKDSGLYAAAGPEYIKVIEEFSDLPNSYRSDLANFWFHYWKDASQTERVREILASAASKNRDPTMAYWLVFLHQQRQPVDLAKALAAADVYEAMPVFGKDRTFAALRKMEIHIAAKEFVRAAEVGEGLLAAKVPGADAGYVLYQIGEAYRQAGNDPATTAKAVEAFRRGAALGPDDRWGRECLWRCVDAIKGDHAIPLLEAFIARDPQGPWVAEARWRIYAHLPREDEERRITLCQAIWTENRNAFWQNLQAANVLMERYAEKKQMDRLAALAREVTEFAGGTQRPEVQNAWNRVLDDLLTVKKDEAAFVRAAWGAGVRLCGSYHALPFFERLHVWHAEKGDHLNAAIALQWGVAAMHPNDPGWSAQNCMRLAQALSEKGRYEESVAVLRAAIGQKYLRDPKVRRAAESLMSACLMQSSGGLAVIDPNLPQAGLLQGDVFARAGEEALAYARFKENRKIFDQYQATLTPAYLHLIAARLLDEGDTETAVEVCRGFIIRNQNNKKVADADRAMLQMLLGDAYFREQRYDLARSEYGTCVNLYPDTPQAVAARFKIGECFMAQKNYEKAEEVFADLAQSPDEDTVIRAMLLQGFLYHSQGKKQETVEQFKKVLALNPRNEVADELFYRLGVVYKESGKLREAYNLFRLVGSGGREAKRVVEPGQPLLFRLSDRDLTITRGGNKVPILVETTSGDREEVGLYVSEAGSGLFVGEIPTALGVVTPGDRVLQIRGTDLITYRYSPDFAKDFLVAEPADEDRTIRVAADAILEVSGTEIPEEEGDEAQIRRAIRAWTARYTEEGRQIFRRANEIKPGNNIYVRLVDRDMDRTNDADSVALDVTAESGDRLRVRLTETGAHTGVFRGLIPTANRPPDALASDSSEGHEPRFAIDGNASEKSAWIGRKDSQSPKWLTVDLKEVFPVDRVTWTRGGKAADRAPSRYVLQASTDGRIWQGLAAVPEGNGMLQGLKVQWDPDSRGYARNILQGNGDVRTAYWPEIGRKDYIIDIDLGELTRLGRTILRPNDGYREVRAYSLLVEKEPGKYPGARRPNDGWEQIYSATLEQPRVDEAAFKDIVCRYIRIFITEQFHDRPEIGEFEVYPVMADYAVAPAKEGAGAEVVLKTPIETRYVRMMIYEYDGDAPAISEISVSAAGKVIVPSEADVHALATNDVLEISPGDTITCDYSDEVNINPGQPRVRRASVYATYYNGAIAVIRHSFQEDAEGNRVMVDRDVYRVEPGQRFIVQVTDFDADTTDGIDELPIRVETSSGSRLDLMATETGPYKGVFTKEVDTTAQEGGQGLFLKPGDRITISYVDRENTDPGNAVTRKTSILANSPSAAAIAIRPTATTRPVPAGAPKPVSLKAPLVVEVRDPDRARDTEDTVLVRLRTTSGDTAEVTCHIGEPDYRSASELLKALQEGRFVGEIPLALGDKDSPDFVVEALRTEPRRVRPGTKQNAEIAVLNVSGRDTILAEYADEASPADPPGTLRSDSARLVSSAVVGIFDDQYENPVTELHVGESLYVKVDDPDADVSNERDMVAVRLSATPGNTVTVQLVETLAHSGVFTRAVPIEPFTRTEAPNNAAQAADGQPPAPAPASAGERFEADFNSTISLSYLDERHAEGPDPVVRTAAAKVVIGSDARLIAFGKKYPSPDIAVETQFKIGECYYYLGRRHMELAEGEAKAEAKEALLKMAREELATGQRILDELVRTYPDSVKIDQAAYLLANLAQEQMRYDEAIEVYRRITSNWPDSPVAPEAQYKIGLCYERKGDFDLACDEYVRLAYKYPENLLIGDAMIRIGKFYFDAKNYDPAITVFRKFTEKYPLHTAIEEIWFKIGLALILQEKHGEAAEHFRQFIDKFPESKLKSAALYWAGDSYMNARDNQRAYQMFKRVVWDFPESKWAKWARGKLASPVFERME